MSQWQTGDGFRTVSSAQSPELLQSCSQKEEAQALNSADCWGPPYASSFHFDANQFAHLVKPNSASQAPLAVRFETQKEEVPLSARLEISNERIGRHDAKEQSQVGHEASPLSRIHDILDVHSPSSRWLEQQGYLKSFQSPNCTLDLTFGSDSRGSKVGAVMTAPDGTKRTVVACEGGKAFQRLTAANGQELVKFLSSGQIVELNPKRSSSV